MRDAYPRDAYPRYGANVTTVVMHLTAVHYWIRSTSFLPDGHFVQPLKQYRICNEPGLWKQIQHVGS